eukprot:15479630-Alexandrium_andersonii.AAC.1
MERRISGSWLSRCEIGRRGRRSCQHISRWGCDQFAQCPCSGQLPWTCFQGFGCPPGQDGLCCSSSSSGGSGLLGLPRALPEVDH